MIRKFQESDQLYIINSHYKLYQQEYNYDLSFRSFVSETVAGFIERNDEREQIWILEVAGKPKGSISIKKASDRVAQLGLFLIEPSLRGLGYGMQLIEHVIHFCKQAGYHEIILWTNKELGAARKLYQQKGFILKETNIRWLSNKQLLEEQWQLHLNEGSETEWER